MKPETKHGLKRWMSALDNSAKGFRFAMAHEAAFREELALVLVLSPIAVLIASGPLQTMALLAGLMTLLIVEVLNSAIEATIDRISQEQHPLSGAAKDLGSLAVTLTIVLNLLLWGFVLYSRNL